MPGRVLAVVGTFIGAVLLVLAAAGTLVMPMSDFAIEDSGIAMPAIALTLAVPLAFAAGARVRVTTNAPVSAQRPASGRSGTEEFGPPT